MHSYVVDQLVLCFEGLALTGAILPETRVVALLWAADVLHRDVRYDLVHRAERFTTRLSGFWGVLVYPHTRVFLLDRRPHVAEEGPWPVSHVHVHSVHVVVHVIHVHRVHVRPGTGHLLERVRSGVHVGPRD